MEEITVNIYPILEFIVILFAIIGAFGLLCFIALLFSRYKKDVLDNQKDIHFKDCDSDIVQDLINRFPLVKTEFISKSAKEQNIENNQEIHELNKRMEHLECCFKELNQDVKTQLDTIAEAVKNHG